VEPANPAPAAPAAAALLRAAGWRDPRMLVAAAAVGAGLLLVVAAPAEIALVRVLALLLPASIVGVLFGSGDVLLLAIVLACAMALSRGQPLAGGAMMGMATALFPRMIPALPFVIVAMTVNAGHRRRASWGAAVGGSLAWLAALAAGTVAVPNLGPGLGFSNLRLYVGAVPGSPDLIGPALFGLVALAAVVAAVRGHWNPPRALAAAAASLIAGLWFAAAASPNDIVVPTALLVTAIAWPHASDLIDSPASAP
jgi:hypothetical protein